MFLLWAWWDSGGYESRCYVLDVGGSPKAGAGLERGRMVLQADTDLLSAADQPGGWHFFADRYPEHLPRKRQLDLPAPFLWLGMWDEALGGYPAADGWVASPGAKLPEPKLLSVRVEIACWFLMLAYLVPGGLILLWWQRRKFRLLKLHAAP